MKKILLLLAFPVLISACSPNVDGPRLKYYQGVFDTCMALTYVSGDPAPDMATCREDTTAAEQNDWFELSNQPDNFWTPKPEGN